MPNRFITIRTELLSVAERDGASVTIGWTESFESKAKNFGSTLFEIYILTKELQKRGITLAHCRFAVNILLNMVQKGFDNAGSPF